VDRRRRHIESFLSPRSPLPTSVEQYPQRERKVGMERGSRSSFLRWVLGADSLLRRSCLTGR